MNSNAQVPTNNNPAQGDVSVVLIQHWARMVDAQQLDMATMRRQIRTIDARATRLYNENVTLHGMFNESEAELGHHQQLNVRLSLLIARILAENPELAPNYAHLHHALIEGTQENPIDLTTDEELDDEDL